MATKKNEVVDPKAKTMLTISVKDLEALVSNISDDFDSSNSDRDFAGKIRLDGCEETGTYVLEYTRDHDDDDKESDLTRDRALFRIVGGPKSPSDSKNFTEGVIDTRRFISPPKLSQVIGFIDQLPGETIVEVKTQQGEKATPITEISVDLTEKKIQLKTGIL